MNPRSPMLLAALAASSAALAVPAVAAAAGSTVIAGPIKAKGYTITLSATDGGASDSFAVSAVKTSGASSQMHSWSFTSGVNVKIGAGRATIKGSLGRYGSIKATVNAGRAGKGVVPKGCTGTPGSTRVGTLGGATKLVLDTTFFKTVAVRSTKAQIVSGGTLKCSGAPSTPTKGLMLTHSAAGAGGTTMLSIMKDGGKVTQMAMRTDTPSTTAPASVLHMITATTGASGLDAAGDLSSAKAAAAGPFLSGTLSFSGTPSGGMATGTLSGDFTAKFDSIGAFTPAAGADAMLMQQ